MTTIAIGINVREDGEPLSEVARAGALYAALLVPVVLPGVVLYVAALRRLVLNRPGVQRRVMALAAAPLAVILLAPSLLAWFGPKSIPWIAAGTVVFGLLARLPPHRQP